LLSRWLENYQPMTLFRCFTKEATLKGLVSKSAGCSSVSMARISINPDLTHSRKWWYFWLIWRVRGRILGDLARWMAPALSSKSLQYTVGGSGGSCSGVPRGKHDSSRGCEFELQLSNLGLHLLHEYFSLVSHGSVCSDCTLSVNLGGLKNLIAVRQCLAQMQKLVSWIAILAQRKRVGISFIS
jgi:hypothetical protein